jgi:hypothetical protein
MVNPSSTKKLAPTPQPAISRLALHDEVTLRLRDMIVEGQLEAGARIQEMELAQVLGVSRTPNVKPSKFWHLKAWWICFRSKELL